MNIEIIIDKSKAKKNNDGIWVSKLMLNNEINISKKSWERIYNLDLKKLIQSKKEFNKDKLNDHMVYIDRSYNFNNITRYLEIGCGPSYIGEYLMKKYNLTFIGIDFNYEMLLTLKKYFDKKGYKKYILIHGNILDMPIKTKTIDYVYGGGVIEHLPDTSKTLKEIYRVLTQGGVSFNTVPAFNLWWFFRFWNNIPNLPVIKSLFEFVHISTLKGKILDKYYGYELSYLTSTLDNLHKSLGFKNVKCGPFVFRPSRSKVRNEILSKIYISVTSNLIFSPVYYIYGTK